MDLYSLFSRDLHRALFEQGKKDAVLILSGANNMSAKAFLANDFASFLTARNIFWILPGNKEIYEIKNVLPFWTQKNVFSLDQLINTEAKGNYRVTEFLARFKENKGSTIYLVNQEDVCKPLPTSQEIFEEGVLVKQGQDMRAVEFFNQLIRMGYQPGADVILNKGQYRRAGGVINIFPANFDSVVKIEVAFDKVVGIWLYDDQSKSPHQILSMVDILPLEYKMANGRILDNMGPEDLLIVDDLDDQEPDFIQEMDRRTRAPKMIFTSFPQNDEIYFHLRYLSILKFYNLFDLLNDLKEKIHNGWMITILTKRTAELKAIFAEERIRYNEDGEQDGIRLIDAAELEHIPPSFQNPETRIELLTDKEIFNIRKGPSRHLTERVNLDFLTGLRVGDLVVHMDHGIGRFMGVVTRSIDDIRREYLEIGYAENDRLFIPIDQADKISKYVGGEENEPQLSRLGATEWRSVSQKVKRETEKIAKDLLELYAQRAQARGNQYGLDTPEQKRFEASFPYQETPGQIKAIEDVKRDMESGRPMDRLVCGDVGFGKTEVAMRAAFKAHEAGRQVAFISPITILADQHYKTFSRRAVGFDVKIEMLSRFRTPREQRLILERLRKGDIDIVIGTHRLLQEDVEFFNLGLVIVDEEQRFGVQQKERFKQLRSAVDILTLTATPIPRTLNLALNKLRDITTITTPPPGRLPIITEVRRYNDRLIIDAIQREVDREGQVYFLHNRVETIDSIAEKFRKLMPHIRFAVAHGKLNPVDLEERIMAFKEKRHSVLISSTIIENGIDLPNANTLIVDDAENLGLAQMYQLRGRIGRSKTQAYAYFLYQSRQPRLDAKKRLRAIVEASELGSGFQIAMRDLEIRGAGDILGINQHGTIRVVGVNHFLRMLNKAIEEVKLGQRPGAEEGKEFDVSIELPLEAFIPDKYIPDTKEKINVYQKLSAVTDLDLLKEIQDDLLAEYGQFPKQVIHLFKVIEIKILAKRAGLMTIKTMVMEKGARQIILYMGKSVRPPQIIELLRYNSKWLISGDKLKINMTELGFNWSTELAENIRHLIPEKNSTPPAPLISPESKESIPGNKRGTL